MGADTLVGESWINANWMFVLPFIGLLLMYRAFHTPKVVENKLLLFVWAGMPIYAIHQFEEHAYDCYGRRYAFVDYLRENLEKQGIDGEAMSPTVITIVNVFMVGVMFPVFALYAERTGDFIPGALGWGMALFNGAGGHVLPALINQKYNPGTIQSAIMLIPIAIMFFKEFFRIYGKEGKRIFIAALIVGGPCVHLGLIVLPVKLVADGVIGTNTCYLWIILGTLLLYGLVTKLLQPKSQPHNA